MDRLGEQREKREYDNLKAVLDKDEAHNKHVKKWSKLEKDKKIVAEEKKIEKKEKMKSNYDLIQVEMKEKAQEIKAADKKK